MARKKASKAKAAPRRAGPVVKASSFPMRVSGTSNQGDINVTYTKLVRTFGEPTIKAGPEDIGAKEAVEWHIQFPDGTLATIYDYKESPLYEAEEPISQAKLTTYLRRNRDWSIGGSSKHAATLVRKALDGQPLPTKQRAPAKGRAAKPTVKKGRRSLREQARCLRNCLRGHT